MAGAITVAVMAGVITVAEVITMAGAEVITTDGVIIVAGAIVVGSSGDYSERSRLSLAAFSFEPLPRPPYAKAAKVSLDGSPFKPIFE